MATNFGNANWLCMNDSDYGQLVMDGVLVVGRQNTDTADALT